MKLLAIDTATDICAAALAEDGNVVADVRLNLKNVHNEQLIALIDVLTEKTGWTLDALDAIVYAQGPGSFTGLRIGIAVAKGLAFTLRKPMIGINTLDSLAFGVLTWPGPVAVFLKARQQEGYFATYRKTATEFERLTDYAIIACDDVRKKLDEGVLLITTPHDFLQDSLAEGIALAPACYSLPQPRTLAELGWQKWQAGEFDDAASVEPFYLKDFEPKRKRYYD